ncbi:MAG: hypothetical protein AB7G08_28665 [Hyphomicrobiaceae bacterium]
MTVSPELVLQLLVSGILLGAVYGVIAIGFTLVFGVMKIVNFAHGHFVMIAMFLGYLLVARLGVDPYLTALAVIPIMLGSAQSFTCRL